MTAHSLDFHDPVELWPEPDLNVLRNSRRKPPSFPVEVFHDFWNEWTTAAAASASAPTDYTGCALLAVASTLIGHARWVSPWPGWSEPPILWIGNVGDPSSGKSPAADPPLWILRDIEADLAKGYPGEHAEWMTKIASAAAHRDIWASEVKEAVKAKRAPPTIPDAAIEPDAPTRPRIVVSDATPEKLAELAALHHKGLTLVRDELSGWYGSLGRYSKSGADRAFWVEAYGGRGFAVDRKNGKPAVNIKRLGLGLFGGIQPDRLCEMMESPDDGLLARFLWAWPNKIPAKRSTRQIDLSQATTALRRLYDLRLALGNDGDLRPFYCPMSAKAADLFERWWVKHQANELVGPLAGPLGKAPGHVARLSLNLEHLWWCARPDLIEAPSTISAEAVAAATALVVEYFHPMNEHVYGDAALPEADRLAAILARWIITTRLASAKPPIINARELRRSARLPGLRDAEKVKLALDVLVEADWLWPAPQPANSSARRRGNYRVNPRLIEVG